MHEPNVQMCKEKQMWKVPWKKPERIFAGNLCVRHGEKSMQMTKSTELIALEI